MRDADTESTLPPAADSAGVGAAGSAGVAELPLEVREALPALDPEALSAFFDAYFDRVHRYIRRLVREEHLAEDLTQEVFLHIHRSLPGYDANRPLSPWVYTIATNKVRDLWRSRRHQEDRRHLSVDDDGEAGTLAAHGLATGRDGAPSAALESRETDLAVAAAVEGLPDMLRATFVLRYYEGLSFQAIGEMVDRNETAVRKRYSRALQELREVLEHLLDS